MCVAGLKEHSTEMKKSRYCHPARLRSGLCGVADGVGGVMDWDLYSLYCFHLGRGAAPSRRRYGVAGWRQLGDTGAGMGMGVGWWC